MTERIYSHSALKKFQRCQLQWKYYYIDKLELPERKAHFARGSDLHTLLELYYTDGDAFIDAYGEASDEDIDLINRYCEKWEPKVAEDWKVLAVEQEFHLEIGEHTLVFIPDLIVQMGDDVWVVDHKTTANIPDEWDEYNMTDFQHLLYIAGVRMLYPNVRGFIFNYMRTKAPGQPKLIKDGSRISNIRALDTDHDTLYNFAERAGLLDHEDVKDKLQILMITPDKYFQRHYIIAPDAAIEQCVADTEAVLDEMHRKETLGGTFPRHVVGKFGGASACSNCDYQPLCHSELLGLNTDLVLLNYIERPPKEDS